MQISNSFLFIPVTFVSFPSSLSKPDMSRLRLAAACALLKLAQEPCYHEIITLEQYQLCALVINVRRAARSFKFNVHACFRALLLIFCVSAGFYFFILYCYEAMNHPTPPLHSLPTFLWTISSFHITVICVSFPLSFFRMSATKCDSVSPRSSTEACAASVCLWNTWQCLLCVQKTLLRRGGLTLASAWWKTSTYAESTSNSTPPSAVRAEQDLNLFFTLFFCFSYLKRSYKKVISIKQVLHFNL